VLRIKHVEINNALLGRPQGRKKVAVMHLADSTLVGLLDAAPDAMLAVDEAGLIVLVNVQAEHLFGYRREDLIGRPVELLVPMADPNFRPPVVGMQLAGRRRDGSEFLAEISLSAMATDTGLLTSAAIRDATERLKTDAESARLKMEAERVRVKAESEKTEAERVRVKAESEKAKAERVRVKAESEKAEAERVRLEAERERVKAESEKTEAERVRLEAERERVKAESEKTEAERVRLEAERVRLEAESVRVKAESEKTEAERVRLEAERVRLEAENVRLEAEAERERLEGQLHQSQRMESLGQLAGGVAHDFNNLLAVILNYASFVAEELTKAAETPAGAQWAEPLKDVEQIQLAAERAGLLTHQLLAFARREVVQARVLSLNSAITRMEQILRRTIGEQVELVIDLAVGLPTVVADPGQIEQIVLNLAINARDAMPAGGTLSIDTTAVEITGDEGDGDGAPSGLYVCFRVGDTGVGMSKEVRDRAFEPFFTTKPKGEGSGLGLATVYGIVSQSGGYTRIYSDAGIGTTITVLLPATRQDATRDEPDGRVDRLNALVGTETILVVEDEEALREVTRRILTSNGYTVVTAASGARAIELAAERAGPIDLVLTDVIMPKMQGPTVAKEVSQLRPGIRVLFMSGHAQPVLEAEAVLGTDFQLVEKPFNEAKLLAKVREVLDAGG
jgi:PAS domain S-box-containing protein